MTTNPDAKYMRLSSEELSIEEKLCNDRYKKDRNITVPSDEEYEKMFIDGE